ncbi:MAG: SDR family oxidoreductase [Minicystis sp.]
MDSGLSGKIAFVTGASGGIGQELTRAFVAEGAHVAACSRRGVPAEARVLPLLADVRRLDEMEAAMSVAVTALGRVDVCVVNAGIWPEASLPLHELPEARVREVVETNLVGAMWTARAFFDALRKTGPRADGSGASLVFIGSTAGRFGEAGHAEYAATKAALRGLVLSLKNEIVALDPWARVNLVEPGWTVTPMAQATLAASGALDQVTRTMPLQRVASPADVAAAVLYLASPALARHVSGETITVAGGMEGRVLR